MSVGAGTGLRRGSNEASLDVYAPQANFLALMMTGDGQAIGSYSGMAYTGSLAWKLKNKIDRCVSYVLVRVICVDEYYFCAIRSFVQLFDVAHMGPSPVAQAPEWNDKYAVWQRSQC
jgi:hypothetical protein